MHFYMVRETIHFSPIFFSGRYLFQMSMRHYILPVRTLVHKHTHYFRQFVVFIVAVCHPAVSLPCNTVTVRIRRKIPTSALLLSTTLLRA